MCATDRNPCTAPPKANVIEGIEIMNFPSASVLGIHCNKGPGGAAIYSGIAVQQTPLGARHAAPPTRTLLPFRGSIKEECSVHLHSDVCCSPFTLYASRKRPRGRWKGGVTWLKTWVCARIATRRWGRRASIGPG